MSELDKTILNDAKAAGLRIEGNGAYAFDRSSNLVGILQRFIQLRDERQQETLAPIYQEYNPLLDVYTECDKATYDAATVKRVLYTTPPQMVDEAEAVKALKEISNWLVCWPLTTAEDMAQNFEYMSKVAADAIASDQSQKSFVNLSETDNGQWDGVIRAFWRRIQRFPVPKYNGQLELPDPLPMEFRAHFATALIASPIGRLNVRNEDADNAGVTAEGKPKQRM